MRVAVLGTGAMGSRMARRLIDSRCFEVTVWNRTPDRARALGPEAVVAETPADAARGQDVVLSMVRDDEAATAAWLAPAVGALDAADSGAVVVECSTTTPAWARSFAAHARERGVPALDAPLAGSRPQAEAGALIFFAGGDDTALARARPVLKVLGSTVHHVGPAGAGAQMKLLVNALFATQVATVAELLSALGGTGLDAGIAVRTAAATPVLSPAVRGAAEAMLTGVHAAGFPIELVVKDLTYALADAAARGTDLSMVGAAAARYRLAAAQGRGQDNITAVARVGG